MSENTNLVANEDQDDVDVEELSSPEMSPQGKSKIDKQQLLAGMEDQLNGLSLDPAAFVKSLPAPVKRRLKALKKLQMEHVKLEAKFFEEIHNIEAKYAVKFSPLEERRAHIVIGEVEPTDSECDWQSDEEDEDEDKDGPESGDTKSANQLNSQDIKGVPEFWLTVLKHVPDIAPLVQEHDEPILRCLSDVKLILSPQGEPMSFTLEFHFTPNEYFTNAILTKKYVMKIEPEENELMYEGPETDKSEGCVIEWKAGKNVTVKTIKKKQKHKKTNVQRVVNKQVPTESFFNFFSPPDAAEQEEPSSEEIEAQLQTDFEIGHYFREQVIPRAVLFFTGEAVEEDSEDDYDEDDMDDDEGASDDADAASGALQNGGKPADCKQQ